MGRTGNLSEKQWKTLYGREEVSAIPCYCFDRNRRIVENMRSQGGGVAQLGEHHVRNVGVEGSIPFSSTTFLHFSIQTMVAGIEPASGADGREPLPRSK